MPRCLIAQYKLLKPLHLSIPLHKPYTRLVRMKCLTQPLRKLFHKHTHTHTCRRLFSAMRTRQGSQPKTNQKQGALSPEPFPNPSQHRAPPVAPHSCALPDFRAKPSPKRNQKKARANQLCGFCTCQPISLNKNIRRAH